MFGGAAGGDGIANPSVRYRDGQAAVRTAVVGAQAVLVARSYVWGLALGGDAGVEAVLRNLLADTDLTLAMAGLSSIDQVNRELLVAA